MGAQVLYGKVQQLPRDPLTTTALLGIHRANIRCKILSVMKIILYNTESSQYSLTIKAKIPSEIALATQILMHTFKICLGRHTPFTVKPFCGAFCQLFPLAQRNKFITH